MDIFINLSLIIILNLSGLLCLLGKLRRQSESMSRAWRLAWFLMMTEGTNDSLSFINSGLLGLCILKRSWWLMNFLILTLWVVAPIWQFTLLFGAVLCLHLWWYLCVKRVVSFDRVIHLDNKVGIFYYEIQLDSRFCLRSLAELDLRKKNLLVLAIERQGEMTSFPKGIEVITAGDRLLIFGENQAFTNIFH